MKIDNVKFFLLMKNYYVKTLDRKPHHLWCGCVLSIQKSRTNLGCQE